MADNADETVDSTNDTTEEVVNTEEVEETDLSETEDLGELQEKNKKLFERAKKAEAEAKLLKAERLKAEEEAKAKVVKTEPSEKQGGLTPKDLYALMEAKVPQDDIEVVSEYAAFKKTSVAEALKSSVIKSELADRAEQRQTAEATNTGTARRGSAKPTPEQVMANVSEGKLPEDPEALAKARWAVKKAKK